MKRILSDFAAMATLCYLLFLTYCTGIVAIKLYTFFGGLV